MLEVVHFSLERNENCHVVCTGVDSISFKITQPSSYKNCQAMHSRHYLHSTRWLDKINAYEQTISQSGNTSEGYNFLSPPASAIKTESTFSEWTRNDYKQHKMSAANVNNSFTAVGDLTR